MRQTAFMVTGFLGALTLCNAPRVFAQEDILGLVSQLSAQSSELQQAQDDLQNRREEVKQQLDEVREAEAEVNKLKADVGNTATPVEGPFRLYMGQYSNTADLRGGGDGEEFESFAAAKAKGDKHRADNATKQPSYRIEDKSGAVLEAHGIFKNVSLDPKRLEAPKNPEEAPEALKKSEENLASKRSAYEQAVKQYKNDRAAYDQNLSRYNASVDQVNRSLPDAIKSAGTPTPTPDELSAPKGDYQVEDLGSLATKYKGKTAKDGTAMAFVIEAAQLPAPEKWGKGSKVEGATIRPGTPIATFGKDNKFKTDAGNHAAIFITQNPKGVWVYDQYKAKSGQQKPVDARFIRFKSGTGTPSNDGSAYSVITKGFDTPDLPERNP